MHPDPVDGFAHARRHGDAQRVGEAGLGATGQVEEARGIGQHRPRLLEEHGPFTRERDPAGGAHEQLHAEFPFKLTDLAAQRGLSDVELPGGF